MDEPEVTFGDLPSPNRRSERTAHSLVAAQLRQRPGEWACIGTRADSHASAGTAHSIRHAKLKSYSPEGAYESTARCVDGRFEVWARYVGEEKPE